MNSILIAQTGILKNIILLVFIYSDYKEYHTDMTVRFVVKMTPEKLAAAEDAGLHKVFKLQTSISTGSMVG